MAFVFLGLLEFAIVNSFMRKAMKFQDAAISSLNRGKKSLIAPADYSNGEMLYQTETLLDPNSDVMEKISPEFFEKMKMKKMAWRRASMVDVSSRVLFPSCFTIFNIYYWMYYC